MISTGAWTQWCSTRSTANSTRGLTMTCSLKNEPDWSRLSSTNWVVDLPTRKFLWIGMFRMEAAGIEPASRGTSAGASTCVACWFNLERATPSGRLRSPQRRESLARPSRRQPGSGQPAVFAPHASRRRLRDGPPFRRPCSTVSWHIRFLPGVLPGLLTTWTRDLQPQPARSNPIRPRAVTLPILFNRTAANNERVKLTTARHGTERAAPASASARGPWHLLARRVRLALGCASLSVTRPRRFEPRSADLGVASPGLAA
jgi:hypothetical protein